MLSNTYKDKILTILIIGFFLGTILMPTLGADKQTRDVTILSEGFEGTGLPSGWLNIDDDGDSYNWDCDFTYTPHTGLECAASASYINDIGALNPDNWLITPAIDLTSYSSASLDYWVTAQDATYPSDHLEIWISTTGTDITDFTDQVDDYTETDDIWKERTVDLSTYIGETIYIAFRHCESYDMYWIKVDDITVSGVGGNVPSLSYSPASYDFGMIDPDQTYSTTFDIWNGGVNQLNWSLSDSESWLTYDPLSGDSTGETDTVNVYIDTTGLTPGIYSGAIDITSNGGNNSFTVSFTILGDNELYAWNIYDSTATVPSGPIVFSDPTIVTSITEDDTTNPFGADFVGETWYAVDVETNNLITIDETDGTVTVIGSTGIPVYVSGVSQGHLVEGLAYDIITEILYACTIEVSSAGSIVDNWIYTIDITTGAATLVGSTTSSNYFMGIAFDNNGVLYGINMGDNTLCEIDPLTCAVTTIGSLPAFGYAQDIGYDRTNDILYWTFYSSSLKSNGPEIGIDFDSQSKATSQLIMIDTNDASTTVIGDFSPSIEIGSLAIPYQELPRITDLTLQYSSTDDATWMPVTGDLEEGFLLILNATIQYYYLNTDTVTTNMDLEEGYFGFYVDPLEQDLAYWANKNVYEGCSGTWEPFMWDIINGTLPMFYLKVSNTKQNFMLVDGLQYTIGQGDNYLRVNGDYPLGTYHYTGTVNGTDGNSSNPITAAITFTDAIMLEDVNQSVFDRGFPIRHAADGDWAGAQNFTTSLNMLKKVQIYTRKFGTPEFDLTVDLRTGGPQGTIIDTIVIPQGDVPSSWTWLEIDFTDTPTTPGSEYFIVCPPAPSGVTTSFGYEWGYAFGNQYDPGSFWFTRDGGGLWRDLPTMYEMVFKTFGA